MAVKTEKVIIKDREYIKAYSDAGFYIERDGEKYSAAIDSIELAAARAYTESAEPIIDEDILATEEDYIEALARLGVIYEEESITE